MRVLAASDIHGNLETYRWLSGVADERRAELMVLAGDLLGSGGDDDTIEEAQRRDAAGLVSILRALSVPAFYIMGNDDWVELTPFGEQIRSLHGERVDRDEFNFVGYQCTLPFMGGVNERSEEAIASDLFRLETLMDERTILVTHSPAAGVLDSTPLGPAGSVSIRDAILRRGVRAHIHGHTHGSFGREGRHFNVAARRQRRAMLIDLNSMVHEVVEGNVEATDEGTTNEPPRYPSA
jgi:Icc-related predicted phosphoesterase